ncbi:MAG: ABC transporter permease [Parvibaculaceae bacterium]
MRQLSQIGWWAASLALFVGVWELSASFGLYNTSYLPPPHIFIPDLPAQAKHFDTAHLVAGTEFASSNFAAMARTTGATVLRVVVGLSLGFVLGVATGIAICYFRIFGRLTLPTITLLAPISPFAWLPVAIFLVGVGDAAAIFLVFVAVYFIIVLATVAEIDTVPQTFINVARIMGASRPQTFFHVILPAILPGLFMILRLNMFAAWMVVLIGESAGVGSGLGAVVLLARNTANMNLVFLGLIVIGIVGLLFDLLLRQVQNRMLYWVRETPVTAA